MPESSSPVPVQLFYSYSHKDESLRDQLKSHLSALTREGLISGWHDRMITAGTEWQGEIDENLQHARIILLLVSASFLDSDYCNDVELRYAMEHHHKGEARVIPVILKPCDWHHTVFAKLQALPKDGKAITKWSNRDDAWLDVVKGIRNALKEVGQGSKTDPDPTLAPATSTSPLASPSIPPTSSSVITSAVINALHGLPTPPADFTGRADELKELLMAVKTGGVTISGLQGMGGIGKTALALKLADQLKNDYPDAQFYVDLKGVTQPLAPKEAMAHVIRAWNPVQQLPEKEEDIAAIYRSVLEGKRVLLLMDNARDAQQVAPLIPPAECLLLVTSRKHFTLPGLVEKNLDKLPPADARELLLSIAPRLKNEKTEKPNQVDELARLCGYLPLALRAVASALQAKRNISPADYVRRLARERLKLTAIDAILQSSYQLLSDRLRQQFRFLAVFPDTFDLAAAAALWKVSPEGAQDSLGELFTYSLVDFDEISRRYRLHDLVCLFANDQLSQKGRFKAERCYARHFLLTLATADNLYEWGRESMLRGLALFDAEWTNIRVGQAWVAAHQHDDDTIAEWCALYPLEGVHCLSLRQRPRERIHWLELSLAAAQRLKLRRLEGAALGNLGLAHESLGEYARAIEYHQQDLRIAREIRDRRSESSALGNLGNAYSHSGEYRSAIECLEQDFKISREIGDRRGEGASLGNLGLAYVNLGEHRRAIQYLESQLNIARQFGDRLGESNALGNLGIAYKKLGEYHRAIESYEQQLLITREIGFREGQANALWNNSLILYQLGDRTSAISSAEAALKIYDDIESPQASTVRGQLAKVRGKEPASGQGSAQ